MEPVGLYLHIPFCRRKCSYCDFYSLPSPADEAWGEDYCRRLAEELEGYQRRWGGFAIDTVYFGGGTPSLLGERRLGWLLEQIARFPLSSSAEITLEANPDTVTPLFLDSCRRSGFNRISFGIQSAHPRELAALDRIHDFPQACRALEWSRQAGFAHISGDLMLGIPYQTLNSLGETLEQAASLGPDHLSAYLLTLEEGTPLAQNRDQYPMMGEEELSQAYLGTVEHLDRLGYRQYEISNFAKPGGESRHNLKYWQLKPYLGLGPGAHSLFGGRRFYYPRDLKGFLEGNRENPAIVEEEPFDPGTEWVMLGLRLTTGLGYQEVSRRFSLSGEELYQRCAPLRQAGYLALDRERLRLTPQGFLLSNQVIGFILDQLEE